MDPGDDMIASLEVGRDAASRRAWPEAVEALTEADRAEGLSPDDLELLGNASWWAGRPDDATEAMERAFAGYEAAGRAEDAARVAIYMAYQASRAMAFAVAGGWAAQANRLLEAFPDSPLHAWEGVFAAAGDMDQGRIESGLEHADRTMAMARDLGNNEALYIAMAFKGMGDVIAGRWKEGMALLDEASAAAMSGNLELRAASDILCITIGACRNLGDLERAAQWADASERWMRRNGAGGYPGICRVHRAELKMLHGRWSEAEQDARQASDELQRFHLLDAVGMAHNAIGDVRLRMGDLDGAAEAFDQAYEFGHDAQPGLAKLQFANGQIDEAQRSIARALAVATGDGGFTDRAARGRLLPTQVEIALARGDLDVARAAVEELEVIAADFDRPLHTAGALTARGELLLGEQRPVEASPILGKSWRLWQTTDLPYEAAQARLRYAEALTAEGDADGAKRDLLAARKVFDSLGATRDLRRVDAILEADGPGAAPAPAATVTKTFMFTDIVTSTDLIELIGDAAWEEMLSWHDRELRKAFAKARGDEVNHTGDGFFVAFDRARDGIDCAVDIQRRLARHRREHGFAPWVRIGLHSAEATRRGSDYSGRGVHIAARVGAAAGREEILATASVTTASNESTYALSEPRELELKGVRGTVEVRAVDWR
jgi:class 3 adenylate cyclase